MKNYLKQIIKSTILEATRYKKETGKTFERWQDKLLKYEQEGGYYISFSFIPRVGLYPINKYNTPIGFYTYPLKQSKIENFAVDRPYMAIVRPKPDAKILYMSSYTNQNLKIDCDKLIKAGYSEEIIEQAKEDARFLSSPGMIWNVTRVLSKTEELTESVSTPEEENIAKAKFRTISKLSIFTPLRKKLELYNSDLSKDEKEYLNSIGLGPKKLFTSYEIDAFRAQVYGNYSAKDKNFFKQLLPLERELLSQGKILKSYIPHTSDERGGGSTAKWTHILLKDLGYDGVVDDSGEGVIHKNEPSQAVFFNRAALEIIEIIQKPEEISKARELFSSRKLASLIKNPNFSTTEFSELLKKELTNPKFNIKDFLSEEDIPEPALFELVKVINKLDQLRVVFDYYENPNISDRIVDEVLNKNLDKTNESYVALLEDIAQNIYISEKSRSKVLNSISDKNDLVRILKTIMESNSSEILKSKDLARKILSIENYDLYKNLAYFAPTDEIADLLISSIKNNFSMSEKKDIVVELLRFNDKLTKNAKDYLTVKIKANPYLGEESLKDLKIYR